MEPREKTLARHTALFQHHGQVLTSSMGLLNAPMSNPDPQDEMWESEITEEENVPVNYTQWAPLMQTDSFFQRADGKWERGFGQKKKIV